MSRRSAPACAWVPAIARTDSRGSTSRIMATAVRLLCALVVVHGSAYAAPPDGPAPDRVTRIRVTGIPDENPTELQRRNAPLVAHLSAALGTKVQYVPVTDYGAAVQALAAGKIDFAWLGGFTHVQARNLADVEPLVMRDIDRDFKSVLIANSASGIESPEDLRGRTFAFGSKSSTSGHLMPRYFLTTRHGIDPDRDFAGPPVFSGAHDATVKLVESGKVAAGAVNEQVWRRMLDQGQVDSKRVRVIWTTPGYVDYVWTARRAVDAGLREKFAQAFLGLDAGVASQAAVLQLQGASRYVRATAADFDAIERVALETGLLEKGEQR